MRGRRGKRSGVDRREEVQAHIRLEAEHLMAEGVPRDEARARARASFGSHPSLEWGREEPRPRWLEIIGRDLRVSARRLVASPGSTAVILLSLMIGIGVSTSIFSLADQVLIRPLPVHEPERVVQLRWDGEFVGGGRGHGSLLPHSLLVDLEDQQHVFESMAARSPGWVSLVTPAGPERVPVELVTGGYFSMLGIRPHVGRTIATADDSIASEPVVVLSHGYWRARFGEDDTVVGRQVRVNERLATVIGVAPRGFHGTDWSVTPAAWVPMSMNVVVHEWGRLDDRRVRFQHIFARLEPGVDRADAEAAIQPWFARYLRADIGRESWPSGLQETEVGAYLASRLALEPGGRGEAARMPELGLPMIVLAVATGLLFLLACLNVANLSVARAVARRRDSAVRNALGASRGRIAGERLAEAGLLAAVGCAAGIVLAPVVGRWLLSYLDVGATGMAVDAGLDARALVIAVTVAVVATLVSGAGPAVFDASVGPMGVLRVRSPGSGVGMRFRKLLVTVQVTLALILLAGALLFGKSLSALRGGGNEFTPDRLTTFTVAPTQQGYGAVESKAVLQRILDRAEAVPGVEGASVVAYPMLEGSGWNNHVLVEGDGRFTTDEGLPMNGVSPGLFDVLGVPILRGRDFGAGDRVDDDGWNIRSAIVSESFVERYLPDQEPLGRRIDFGGDPSQVPGIEIVGVVADYHEHDLRRETPQVYFPLWERTANTGTFYVRSSGSAVGMIPALRQAVASVDPGLTVTGLRTVEEQIDHLLASERMLAALGRAFAGFAMLLAVIGLYGVLAYAVESRTREVGIRVALGARRSSVARLIVNEAATMVAAGVALALPAIWAAGRLVESQLFGTEPTDPGALLLATAILVLAAFAASALPAVRLARTTPLEALRAE